MNRTSTEEVSIHAVFDVSSFGGSAAATFDASKRDATTHESGKKRERRVMLIIDSSQARVLGRCPRCSNNAHGIALGQASATQNRPPAGRTGFRECVIGAMDSAYRPLLGGPIMA